MKITANPPVEETFDLLGLTMHELVVIWASLKAAEYDATFNRYREQRDSTSTQVCSTQEELQDIILDAQKVNR